LTYRNPNIRILLDSETYNLSKSILAESKGQFQGGPLANNYPPLAVAQNANRETSRWSEDVIVHPRRTIPKKEGTLSAAGLDGVKAGMHYDIIIADDLHSQQNTRSKYQIEQVIEHYRLLLSILEPNGVLIVIGTRWALEDAYTQIAKDADTFVFVPAASARPMSKAAKRYQVADQAKVLVYDHQTNEAHSLETGDEYYLNFPQTLPLSHLLKMEQRQGTYIYSAQYILRPVASHNKRFKEENIQFYTPDQTPLSNISTTPLPGHAKYNPLFPSRLTERPFVRFGFVDPAFTTSDYSDYSGIITMAVDHDRNMFVMRAEKQKFEPPDLLDFILKLNTEDKIQTWFIEEVAAQKVLRFYLEYKAKHDKVKINIVPVKSGGRKKEIRIMSLQPYFENKKVFMLPTHTDLIQEIKLFPMLAHDDLIDALAYAPMVVYDGSVAAQAARPIPEFCFNRFLKEQKDKKAEGIRPRNFDPLQISGGW
jgi:predicted phage terminase large subunit-like protein